jgi:hypothetical protein
MADRVHLVDLENLLGDPRANTDAALATFGAYLEVAHWSVDDHVIIATNPWLMTKIAFDLPVPASRHAVHGRDGADTMLLSLAPVELVVKRYGRLVIVCRAVTASSPAGRALCATGVYRSTSSLAPTVARRASTSSAARS